MAQPSRPHTTGVRGAAASRNARRRDPDLRRQQRQGTQSCPQCLQSFLREDIRRKSVQAPRDRAEGLLASRVVHFGALHISRRGADRTGGIAGADEGRGVSAGAWAVFIGAEAGVDGAQAVVVGVNADARSDTG